MPTNVLETPRLVLRPHTAADFDDCAALWADPQVTRFIGGVPSTREQSWGRILRYLGHWPALGYGFWVVHERPSGRFVGEVGLADFKREITPAWDGPEAGWVLSPWCYGKGYATEAVQVALAWFDAHIAAPATRCIIDPPNLASIRVAQKCGYRELHRGQYGGDPVVVYERARGGALAAPR